MLITWALLFYSQPPPFSLNFPQPPRHLLLFSKEGLSLALLFSKEGLSVSQSCYWTEEQMMLDEKPWKCQLLSEAI